MDVTFRRLTADDHPMLHRWLNEPGVVAWWEGDDVSWEGVVRDYRPDDEDVEHWIVSVDSEDVGWIQCYLATDDDEECAAWFRHGIDRTAAGIDYLVADPGRRGTGVGTAMIRAFVRDIVFGLHPGWTQAAASPYEANEASWRALARAGFRHVATIRFDGDDGPCRLMAIDRGEVSSAPAGERGGSPGTR